MKEVWKVRYRQSGNINLLPDPEIIDEDGHIKKDPAQICQVVNFLMDKVEKLEKEVRHLQTDKRALEFAIDVATGAQPKPKKKYFGGGGISDDD